jgi:2-phosphosulfolactate phosphatase
MRIEILQLLDGARKAEGLTVIIDVFRAFTTACYIYRQGAEKIIPVGGIELAYQMKLENPGYILVGERDEQKPVGFDFGNSPTLIKDADLKGRTIIHTTSSGTQGIVNAINATEIITGGFANAGAIVRYIKEQKPEKVSLVCMGYACLYPTDEDTFCAEYIKGNLEGKESNFLEMVRIIRQGTGARFFDQDKQGWSPESDFHLCLTPNQFDFVLKVEEANGFNYLKRIEI